MQKHIENKNSRYVMCRTAMERFNLGYATLNKIAIESNAKIKIGRSVRIDIEVLGAYIDSLNGKEEKAK